MPCQLLAPRQTSTYVQAEGYRVAYGRASVYHDRNIHDPVRDMKQDYLGHENNLAIVQELPKNADALCAYLAGRAICAFEIYKRRFVHA